MRSIKIFGIIGRDKRLVYRAYLVKIGIGDIPSADPEGGTGGPDPPPPPSLKNHTNKGFLSNTGPDPLKITKLSSQHSVLGLYQQASKMPFKWRFAGGTMIARLIQWYFDPPSPHQLKKKDVVKVGPLLTKCSGSAHAFSLIGG